MGLFNRKKPAPISTPAKDLTLQEKVQPLHDQIVADLNSAKLHLQKIAEKEEGLRYIVAQTDLTEDNLVIRKNSISELLDGEIKELQEELIAVNKLSEDIQASNYDLLLQQASNQKTVDITEFDSAIKDMSAMAETTGKRKELVEKAEVAGSEYKKLATALNTKVASLKTLLGSSDSKLIESEKAHVATLISMLEAHRDLLTQIKVQMDTNPNIEQVKQAKQTIQNALEKYDARTESAKLNEIREENTAIEKKISNFFTESAAILDLEKQVEAKGYAITQITGELDANSNLLVF
ncbi:hypothetical protein HOE39_00070 [Candidatus Woesearchaeota archaeon]|jgi:hypothetical protein|nr:hypothetical protein [Candidatus Woesearchaeota archaeon]